MFNESGDFMRDYFTKSRLHKINVENKRRIDRHSKNRHSSGKVTANEISKVRAFPAAPSLKKSNGNGLVKREGTILSINKIWTLTILIVVIILLSRTVSFLNSYSLQKSYRTIIKNGLDYDYFRDMLLPEEIIGNINTGFLKDDEQQVERCSGYAAILTLLKQNGLIRGEEVSVKKVSFFRDKLKDYTAFGELMDYYKILFADLQVFPLDRGEDKSIKYTFGDTWSELRNYGGNRRHEGTDIFPEENVVGKYRVISASDGVVERIGWLEKGGYRVGIRTPHGAYLYYAHLDSYAENLKLGDRVKAGDFLGFMGDSGYGTEGTKGMFPVHLHFGMYIDAVPGEISVNPYSTICYLESKQ
jgi:murein DD-endopeptidase MepM/ murein hydrolase activator NlpD